MSNGRASSIPSTSRKMVQSLKEIVNCPEHEIYAMLKECNMDPNDTINRLLSQDTFHEVKSKREKKKEIKESTDYRSRGVHSTSSRGGRGGTDRSVGRSGSTQVSSSDSGVIRSKPAYQKEYSATIIPNSSYSVSGMVGSNINHRSTAPSDSVSTENTVYMIGTADDISLSSQPSSGFQPAWVRAPGQVSMADIVKMGRPHGMPSNTPISAPEVSYSAHNASMSSTSQHNVKHPLDPKPLPSELQHDIHSSQEPASKFSEIIHEPVMNASQHASRDDWPLIELSTAASGSSLAEPSGSSAVYADPSLNPRLDEVQVMEADVTVENLAADCIGPASDRLIQADNSGSTSHFDDSSFQNRSAHPSQRLAFEHQEGIGGSSHLSISDYPVPSSDEDIGVAISSAAVNLQQLNLQNDLSTTPAEDNRSVIIPKHLQVPTVDCSHLSFGSFGSGISATFSGSFSSKTLKGNTEEASISGDGSSIEHPDARNPEYYGNENMRSTSNENVDSPSSQPEVVKPDTAEEMTHGHQYSFPSSVPNYAFENTAQQSTATYSYLQANSQQAYTNSLPSNLLASGVQPLRESDLPYSPFLATQSMPTKYSTAMSSISGPSISIPEASKTGVFNAPQPTQQTLPSTSIPTGPTLPQHLAMHPYSQATHPLGPFANMIGYPILPQSYTYMPPAFQQAYAGNSAYHQSPATVHSAGVKYTLPQYKSTVSVSSLPQSADIASAYGGFGSSTNVPGSFTLNPSTTLPSTTIGYEDVISSQYKDNSHYVPLQQNEGSAMWVHGPGSRTISALPASTYYTFQGQDQHSGFRQGQQPSHYGTLGYPNFYHSQTGVSQEHQQTPNDGALPSSQGPPSQQSHQIWQQSY